MNINPVNSIKFGEVSEIEIQNLERKIADLQSALDRKELADVRREAERNNRPFYPPNMYPYPQRMPNPYGMPIPPYGMPNQRQPYGPYNSPQYPPINTQPPVDGCVIPPKY